MISGNCWDHAALGEVVTDVTLYGVYADLGVPGFRRGHGCGDPSREHDAGLCD